ncbi:CDC42 rho GTPase-activating protein [Amanita muscaria]
MPPKLNTLTLKQRLAALSLSTSSPSTPRFQNFSTTPSGSTLSSPTAKFTPPWAKKHRSQEQVSAVYHDEETIQSVLVKMIFQAGVDYETRPMVVINASALPDPQTLNYDILLTRILAYLNLYVESDYTVVFFGAGGRHTPGWNWLWKAYRSLSRKYRKNLKQLYIVHSSFFTKMLFSLAGAMISPKFFRKIIYIETLSELALHIPITQIDIPPAVYKENAKFEEKITLPVPVRSNIFGLPLEELMGFYGEKGGIPRVVRDSIQYLRETALEEEGLFRHSAQSSVLRAAQAAYDRGNVVSLHTFGDPNIAAVLLKKFLRDLPEPIFPERLYPVIQQCPPPGNGSDASEVSSVHYIRETLLPELAPCAYILLSQVLHLMHDVSLRSSVNKMDAHNLAIVLTPNLVQGKNPLQDASIFSVAPTLVPIGPHSPTLETNGNTSSMTLGVIIKLCIQRYYEIFDGMHDLAEAIEPSIEPEGLTMRDESTGTAVSSSLLDGSTIVEGEGEEEEEIDDEILVMPIGPRHSRNGSALQGSGEKPVPWDEPKVGSNTLPSSPVLPSPPASPSPLSTMDTPEVASGDRVTRIGGGVPYSTLSKSKAKSVIGIEKGGVEGGKRRGSISVGRSGTGKSPGSGVEALGVTAAGFFSPPGPRP